MLRIEVIGGADADEVALRLRRLDTEDRLRIIRSSSSPDRGRALVGLVVAAPSCADAVEPADVVLAPGRELDAQVTALWQHRLRAFSARMSGERIPRYPAVMHPYDPEWPRSAERRIDRLRRGLATFEQRGEFGYEHMGSTSVPGIAAKAVIDLQITVPELLNTAAFGDALHQLGYLPATGSRPDSPGVYRDIPRGSEVVPDEVWSKRLFYSPDPQLPSILHIRRSDSPWGRYTLLFRDWLRAHPAEAERYQRVKTRLAETHAQHVDYDDYTRAKTHFFDEVQDRFEEWGRKAR